LGGETYDERENEIFRNTQLAKLRSYYVLQAAVRNPGIASLVVFANQRDPVAWLQERVETEYVGNSELLAIRLRGPEAHTHALIQIVDAVAKAYEDEVVFADSQTRRATRDLKAGSLTKLQNELLDKTQDLIALKHRLGAKGAQSAQIQVGQKEIEVLTEVVQETRRSLEFNDIEANAPPRIRKVQPAVPSLDN
jgi:hypothetical protein